MSDSGRADELRGKVKEGVGAMRGDEKQRREGQAVQAKGKLKQARAKLKDAIDDAADAVKKRPSE